MSLTKEYFMEATEACPVIPAIKNDEWLEGCKESECGIVYIIYGDICTIADIVDKVKEMGKKIGVVVYCDEDKQQQVRDFITESNRTLPLYKRMSAVEFSTEPLPRNGAGKLLRQ